MILKTSEEKTEFHYSSREKSCSTPKKSAEFLLSLEIRQIKPKANISFKIANCCLENFGGISLLFDFWVRKYEIEHLNEVQT